MKHMLAFTVLALLVCAGFASAQPSSTPVPETPAGNLNLSVVDRVQYIVGGESSVAGGLKYFGYADTFFIPPESVQIVQVLQVDLLYPAFLMYSAYGYATNATGFTATYAGPDVTLANFTEGASTPNGSTWDAETRSFSVGRETGGGRGRLTPVKYAADELMSGLSALPINPAGVVSRENLSTTYVIAGNASDLGPFTGVSYIATSPDNGVIDNNTIIWTFHIKENTGEIATYVGTGRPTTPGDFSKFDLTIAGAGTGGGPFSIHTVTPDGPILFGNFSATLLNVTIPVQLFAFPVKQALRVVGEPVTRRKVKRIVPRDGEEWM